MAANQPTSSIILWSVISFVILLAGVGTLVWYFAVQRHSEDEDSEELPQTPRRSWRSKPHEQRPSSSELVHSSLANKAELSKLLACPSIENRSK